MKGVFTIDMDRRFADELAAGVLAQYGSDPLRLADVLILLPTRRSVRALSEAFLRAASGKPTILPSMAPLGDLDEGEWIAPADDGGALALPPAIDSTEREALLAELVAAFKDDQGQPIAQSAAQALKLARELGGLLDELAIDGVAFDKLTTPDQILHNADLWLKVLKNTRSHIMPPAGNPPPPPVPPVVDTVDVDFDGTILWNDEVVDRGGLDARIVTAAAEPIQPELHLRPNKLVTYKYVAAVMADAQRLGLTKLSLVGNEQFVDGN